MKSILTSIAAGSLLAGLAIAQPPQTYPPQPRYTVTDLGTLGGTSSNAYGPNVVGWVAGNSNLAPNGPQHAQMAPFTPSYGPGKQVCRTTARFPGLL